MIGVFKYARFAILSEISRQECGKWHDGRVVEMS
jgi:hypothetical protein